MIKINYFLIGIFLTAWSLGSMFAIDLARYSFFLLIAVFLITLYYYNESLIAHYKKNRMGNYVFYSGFLGLFLLSLFFGIQSPQLPFKVYVLIVGVIFVLIGFFVKPKKKLKGNR